MTSTTNGRVQIVTDSTSDLTQDDAQRLGVRVVALWVYFGEQGYQDGVTISSDEFYARLTGGKVFPKTSQPVPEDYANVYRELAPSGPVLTLTVSSKVSGTYNSAVLARDMVMQENPDAVIEVVDSAVVGAALGHVTQSAAEQAAQGASVDDIAAWVRDVAARTRIYFAVDTLEYLARGGRIGHAQAFLGGLLSLKPVLEFRDGEVHPFERVRSRSKAHARLEALVHENAPVEHVMVATSTDLPRAQQIADRIGDSLGMPNIPVYGMGAVVGAYTGPGCVSVAIIRSAGDGTGG